MNTILFNIDHVRTVFPSFHIKKIDKNDQRGYFTFEGNILFILYCFIFEEYNLV